MAKRLSVVYISNLGTNKYRVVADKNNVVFLLFLSHYILILNTYF